MNTYTMELTKEEVGYIQMCLVTVHTGIVTGQLSFVDGSEEEIVENLEGINDRINNLPEIEDT